MSTATTTARPRPCGQRRLSSGRRSWRRLVLSRGGMRPCCPHGPGCRACHDSRLLGIRSCGRVVPCRAERAGVQTRLSAPGTRAATAARRARTRMAGAPLVRRRISMACQCTWLHFSYIASNWHQSKRPDKRTQYSPLAANSELKWRRCMINEAAVDTHIMEHYIIHTQTH